MRRLFVNLFNIDKNRKIAGVIIIGIGIGVGGGLLASSYVK